MPPKTKSSKKKKGSRKEKKAVRKSNKGQTKNDEEGCPEEVYSLVVACYQKTAADSWDKDLFKQPPHEDECPICLLRMPSNICDDDGESYKLTAYFQCCGKNICVGCVHAMREETGVMHGSAGEGAYPSPSLRV